VKAEIARIFKKLDVTGDGVLELDELAEVVGFYQGYKFDEDEFFGYWDVLGAHTDYIGAHHAEDHKSHSLHVNELGWYLADCAGLANYRSATGGTLDSYTSENLSENMFNTIKNFEAAIDIIQERQKQNKHPLMISKEHHSQYQGILKGHRRAISLLFKDIDTDGGGTLDVDELRDIIKEVEGKDYDEAKFFAFFRGKTATDTLSQMEFGWYVASKAGKNEKMSEFIDQLHEVRQHVHERYIIEKKEGKKE